MRLISAPVDVAVVVVVVFGIKVTVVVRVVWIYGNAYQKKKITKIVPVKSPIASPVPPRLLLTGGLFTIVVIYVL